MMDKDDELRDLLGGKHQEDQFSFDKDNWEKLALELKEERKSKKRLLIFLSVLGFFIGTTGVYFLNHESKKNTELSFISHKSNPSLEPANTATETTGEKNQESLKHPNPLKLSSEKIESETPEKIASEKIKTGTPTQNLNEKIKADISLTKKIKSVKTQATLENTGPNILADIKTKKSFSPAKSLNKSNESKEEAKSTNLPKIKQNNPGSELTKMQQNNEESNATNSPAIKQNNSESGTPKAQQSGEENKLTNQPKLQPANTEPGLTKQQNPIPENNFMDSVSRPKPIETSNITLKEEPLAKMQPTVSTSKTDSSEATSLLNKDSLAGKSDKKNIFSFDLGTDYLFGWKNSGKTEANGFNPVIGLTYYNAITPKIGVSIGVQYTSVNNLNATSHTSTDTKLKFGEESDVTKISATKMYYLIIPLKLNYCINNNNFIGLGYNLGILFDVKSNVETYTERFESQSNYQVSTARGYRSGFNNFDGQLSVSYRRRIYKELFISSELFYGLRDIKDNDIYKSAVFERNCGLKLMLSYNFLKK